MITVKCMICGKILVAEKAINHEHNRWELWEDDAQGGKMEDYRLTDEVVLEPENTPLGKFQKERTDAISEMFDNPDAYSIYPTGKFFARLDNCVRELLDAQTAKSQQYYASLTPEQVRGEVVRWLRIIGRASNETEWKACRLLQKWEDGYCKDKDCSDCIANQILSLINASWVEYLRSEEVKEEVAYLIHEAHLDIDILDGKDGIIGVLRDRTNQIISLINASHAKEWQLNQEAMTTLEGLHEAEIANKCEEVDDSWVEWLRSEEVRERILNVIIGAVTTNMSYPKGLTWNQCLDQIISILTGGEK